MKSDHLRHQIINNINYAKTLFKEQHLMLFGSHISFIKTSDSQNDICKIEQYLKENGLDAKAIRFPSVQKGQERMRVTLKSFNTQLEIKKLVTTLREIL